MRRMTSLPLLREALDYVKQTRSNSEYQRFAKKLSYVEVYKQNHLGPHRQTLGFYMDTFYPDMDAGAGTIAGDR